MLLAGAIEQAVDEEGQPHDDQESADADRLACGASPANAIRTIRPKPTPISVTPARRWRPGGCAYRAIPRGTPRSVHRRGRTARIDLRRRHQASFDHRDALADLELPHPRLGQRPRDAAVMPPMIATIGIRKSTESASRPLPLQHLALN